MGTVVLGGSIVLSPSGDCGVPSGITNIQFAGFPQNKSATVSAYNTKSLNTPAPSFFTLDGIGPSESVTQGNFLYIRTTSPIRFRFTSQGPSGDDVSVLTIQGVVLLEFNSANYLKLLEAQGVGTVEYLVSGNV